MSKRLFKRGIFRTVVKNSGLGHACLVFLGVFAVCAALIWLLDPQITTLGDALWYCFQVMTTIGFGDILATTMLSRVVSVVLSVVSVFFIAVLTASVVSYTSEMMRARRSASLAEYLDKLEHLPELSHEELVELSERIKALDARSSDDGK